MSWLKHLLIIIIVGVVGFLFAQLIWTTTPCEGSLFVGSCDVGKAFVIFLYVLYLINFAVLSTLFIRKLIKTNHHKKRIVALIYLSIFIGAGVAVLLEIFFIMGLLAWINYFFYLSGRL